MDKWLELLCMRYETRWITLRLIQDNSPNGIIYAERLIAFKFYNSPFYR